MTDDLISRKAAIAAITLGNTVTKLHAAIRALPAVALGEPEAVRYGFDGYGWKYMDAGSGSDWLKRAMAESDAEPLYDNPASQTDRATFDAMCAMRDTINEYVPMPSLESDLLQGPENSVFCATVAEAVIAEITRLRAASQQSVRVKPLVWSPYFNGFSLHTDTRLAAYSDARTVVGTYSVGRQHSYIKSSKPDERPFDYALSSSWWLETPNRKILGPFNGDMEAKAAAQADYEQRIRTAI